MLIRCPQDRRRHFTPLQFGLAGLGIFGLSLSTLIGCAPSAAEDVPIAFEPGTNDPNATDPGTTPNNTSNASPSRAGALAIGNNPNGGAPLCSGNLAADTFRYGVCLCGDLDSAGRLETASFRGQAPSDDDETDGTGGGVGVNGNYGGAGSGSIGGTLSVGGDFDLAGAIDVRGELRVSGDFSVAGSIDVGRDAYLQSDVNLAGQMSVEGDLHVTRELGFSSFFVEANDVSVEDFVIDAPCDCGLADDIQSFIAQAETDNDNLAADVASDDLESVVGQSDVVLQAGRYYFDRMQTAGALTITVNGPTAIYIAGDVNLAGALEIGLDGNDASLDLFIGGDLDAAGHLEIGSQDDPDRVRVYLASSSDLSVAGQFELGSALYAPLSTLSIAGDAELMGALVIGNINSAGRLRMFYDADLQDADDACEPVAPNDEPADQPADEPADQPDQPADEPGPPAPSDDVCEGFMDCPDPQVCIEGTCTFIEG